jgi:hypothetical protein
VFALRHASRLLALFPNPPIRQAHSAGQQSAATQKIAGSFLRLLSLFAATVLFELLQCVSGERAAKRGWP